MTITELIAALEALRAEHGDLRILIEDGPQWRAPLVETEFDREWRGSYTADHPRVVTL